VLAQDKTGPVKMPRIAMTEITAMQVGMATDGHSQHSFRGKVPTQRW
jgi:hypothetical protein